MNKNRFSLSCIYKPILNQRKKKISEIIKTLHKYIEEKNLTAEGYETQICKISIYQKKYGLQAEQYYEVLCVSKSISELINNAIYNGPFSITEIITLTKCITRPEYQPALFNFNSKINDPTSPEYFFEKILWDKIIIDELIENPTAINQIDIWLKLGVFSLVTESQQLNDIVDELKEIKEIDCCAYFLTFFVLSLVLKLNPDFGYKKYINFISFFDNIPEIKFVLNFIMFSVLRNLNNVKNTYFNQNNNFEMYRSILENYKEDNSSWLKIDKVSRSFKKSFKDTVTKIVYDNCRNTQNEIFYADCTIASEIMGDNLNNDPDWQDTISKIEQRCSEVFTR